MPYHTVQGEMRHGKIILQIVHVDADVCVAGRRSPSSYSGTRRAAVLRYL